MSDDPVDVCPSSLLPRVYIRFVIKFCSLSWSSVTLLHFLSVVFFFLCCFSRSIHDEYSLFYFLLFNFLDMYNMAYRSCIFFVHCSGLSTLACPPWHRWRWFSTRSSTLTRPKSLRGKASIDFYLAWELPSYYMVAKSAASGLPVTHCWLARLKHA